MDGWTPQGYSPVYPLWPDKKMPHLNIQVELIFPENGKKGDSENRILVQTVLFFFKHLIAGRAARPVARAWQGTLLCLLSHIFSDDLPYLSSQGAFWETESWEPTQEILALVSKDTRLQNSVLP